MGNGLLTVIDAVESWLVLLPLIVQIPLLLAVLLPVAWGASWVIDRLVEFALRRHTARSEREVDAELVAAQPPSSTVGVASLEQTVAEGKS